MKRTLSLFLTLIMAISVLTSVPITVNAASVDDLTFELNEEGTMYQIKECNIYASGDIIVPDTYNGLPVVKIASRAFQKCTEVKSVIIGDSVTSIGSSAFYGCYNLTSITIPNSVTSIGSSAFYDCYKLTSITIPDSVTSIGGSTFTYCRSLASVTIPDSVTTIGDFAFYNCTSLTSITIPNSVTSIGSSAFYDCYNLTSITIPDSVTSIGEHAFYNCTSLTSVAIGDSVTSIDEFAFYDCYKLTSITIPDSVTSIGRCAFSGCSSLTSVAIGDSVTSIDELAFSRCSSLNAVYITDIAKWCEIYFDSYDSNPLYYAKNLYLNGELVTALIVPDGVTSIGDNAFRAYASLTLITIPDSVTSIGNYAFEDCTSLKTIEISDGLTSIGYEAFRNCTSLNSITIPDSVTSIGDYAFSVCTSLNSITISDSVTSIGSCTFSGCTSLTSITIPDSVTSIGSSAFYKCTSLSSITIPDSATSIGYESFYGCESLELVTIPNSITSIDSSAFYDCKSLASVKIPDSVTRIGNQAFGYKYSSWEEKTVRIENFTIYGCKGSAAQNYATENGFTFIEVCGHKTTEWVTDKEATVYKAGSKHKECTECGEVLKTATIKQLKCAKPVLKKVYNANNYVKVTWGTVKGADKYYVYRKTGTGSYEYIGSTSKTYFNDKEAGAGKTCRYIVKAKNEAGNSEASASIAIKHVDEPTLKSIENSAYGVLIKWDKVTGAEKYNVYRKVSGGEYKYIGATSNTYYTDKTAKSGTKYYYAIRGKRDTSVSSQSASLSKYYLDNPTLNTPSSTSKGVGLRWSEITGAEGYMVYRRTADGSYERITTEKGVSNVTYRDTTAKKGTKYYYKVKAYKSKTYSAYSNTKAITDKY